MHQRLLHSATLVMAALLLCAPRQEDIMEEPAPRMFWPKAIWGQYGKTLEDFKEASNRKGAVRCLNHMVRVTHVALH